MLFVVGILLAALGVAISIALHELGHLIPAKKFGVKVTQYMVGFGPTVWSTRRGETEYGIKAIPLGGYNRMIGMFPPRPGQDDSVARGTSTGRFGQLTEQVRDSAMEEIAPADRDRVFYKLKSWQKIVVMFSGPFVNLVIAAVLLTVLVCGFGVQTPTRPFVDSVAPCLTATGTTCSAGSESPAKAAGLRPGDVLVSIDGQKVTSTVQITDAIRDRGGQTFPIVVKRNGRDLSLTVTPRMTSLPRLDGSGNPVLSKNGTPEMVRTAAVGITIGSYAIQRQPVTAAPRYIGSAIEQTAAVFVRLPQKMVGVYNAAFSGQKRSVSSPMSVVGVGRIAGDVTESSRATIEQKAGTLIGLIASLNLALFVFNMIPLLPLDGGHIAGAIWESIKRPILRRRGRQGPIYADVTKALPLVYAVSVVLIVMSGLLMYADVVNPVPLGG